MAFVEAKIEENEMWTRVSVRNLYLKLSNLKGIKDNDLNYAITRTLDHIKGIAEAVDDSKRIPLTDDFKLFMEKKQNLLKELSEGKVKMVGEQEVYDIDFTDKKVIEAIDKLEKEYEGALEERKIDIELYNKWIQGEVTEEVKLHKIHSKKIPEGTDIEIWKVIAPIIIYDEPSEEKVA